MYNIYIYICSFLYIYKNIKYYRFVDYLVKGRLLLGGLGRRGGLGSDHVQAGSHIWDVSLNDVNRKVTVAFGLHWLLLKCLKHLLKLTKLG